jgi:hypothetical protein
MAIYIQRSEFITLLGGAPPAAMAAAAAVPLKKLARRRASEGNEPRVRHVTRSKLFVRERFGKIALTTHVYTMEVEANYRAHPISLPGGRTA